MLIRTPAIHHQLISLIRPQGTIAQWSIHGRTTMHKTHRDSPKATVGSIFFGKPDPDAVGAKALVERLGNNYTSSIVGTKRVVSCKLSSKTFAVGKYLTELMCHLSNLSSTSGLHCFSQHAWANPPCHFVHDSTSRCSGAWLPDEDVPVLGVSLKPTKKHGM